MSTPQIKVGIRIDLAGRKGTLIRIEKSVVPHHIQWNDSPTGYIEFIDLSKYPDIKWLEEETKEEEDVMSPEETAYYKNLGKKPSERIREIMNAMDELPVFEMDKRFQAILRYLDEVSEGKK